MCGVAFTLKMMHSTAPRIIQTFIESNDLCSGLLRAIGNSFMPLVFLIFSSLVNIVLDLLFIRTFGMGVRGAAIATVIAQGISVVLCLIYIVTKAKILLPEKRHFALDRGLYADLAPRPVSTATSAFRREPAASHSP